MAYVKGEIIAESKVLHENRLEKSVGQWFPKDLG